MKIYEKEKDSNILAIIRNNTIHAIHAIFEDGALIEKHLGYIPCDHVFSLVCPGVGKILIGQDEKCVPLKIGLLYETGVSEFISFGEVLSGSASDWLQNLFELASVHPGVVKSRSQSDIDQWSRDVREAITQLYYAVELEK